MSLNAEQIPVVYDLPTAPRHTETDPAASYRETVCSLISDLKRSGQPVIVFGVGRAGWYLMKVLEHFDVPIAAFSGNDPVRSHFHGYQVLTPEAVVAEIPRARIVLGVFVPETGRRIRAQLERIGLREIHCEMAAFLFMYQVEVAGRKCDHRILARSIHVLFRNYREGADHYGLTREGYFVSPYVTSVITQKCTLRCRDCAQRIPYYRTPVHFPVSAVIADLKRYARAFDVVPEISLHGGEPFLHPDVGGICREAAAIPNIVFVSFVTNGTLMLDDEVLNTFAACGADVHQSGGYGPLSRRRAELFEAFGRHGIYSDTMFCNPSEKWIQPAECRKHSRSSRDTVSIYRRCMSTRVCCQIMDGEMHRCALSMHGAHQGLFPKEPEDYVRLHEPDEFDHTLSERIRAFLTRERPLTVCDYCDPNGGVCVEPAIQLPLRQRDSLHSQETR